MAQRKHVPDISKVRDALNPRRERYDLAFVMERWVAQVRGEQQSEHGSVGADDFEWNGMDDPEELLAGPASPRASHRRPKRGRHPTDSFAALMLAVIFHEFTGEPPTRKWNARRQMETSNFYKFGEVAFREFLGRTAPWSALHEACERWGRSRAFNKTAMHVLLFGGLVPKKGARLRRSRRQKSPPPSSTSD
jgi:hypothetical protein